MTQLAQTFKRKNAANGKSLIAYITAGYPDYQTTLHSVLAAAEAGADVIEIGLPFSDPMADGPIIQKAATEALKNGATTRKTLELVKEIRKQAPVPLVIMTYVNIVLRYGVEAFIKDFAAAGVCGLIVPDLPVEESEFVEQACREHGVDLIQFIAPTSTRERIAAIAAKGSGFIYCISNTGVTGVKDVDFSPVGEVIAELRRHSAIPAAIGFGIGSAQAACAAAGYADAVIIGSAVMERLMAGEAGAVKAFIGSVRAALDKQEG